MNYLRKIRIRYLVVFVLAVCAVLWVWFVRCSLADRDDRARVGVALSETAELRTRMLADKAAGLEEGGRHYEVEVDGEASPRVPVSFFVVNDGRSITIKFDHNQGGVSGKTIVMRVSNAHAWEVRNYGTVDARYMPHAFNHAM